MLFFLCLSLLKVPGNQERRALPAVRQGTNLRRSIQDSTHVSSNRRREEPRHADLSILQRIWLLLFLFHTPFPVTRICQWLPTSRFVINRFFVPGGYIPTLDNQAKGMLEGLCLADGLHDFCC